LVELAGAGGRAIDVRVDRTFDDMIELDAHRSRASKTRLTSAPAA
jgi:hypothetical protein